MKKLLIKLLILITLSLLCIGLVACGELDEHEHNYQQVVTNPTCEEKGYTTYTCSCGDTYKDNYTNALEHKFGYWSLTVEATCTTNGEEKSVCEREGCDYVGTRKTDMLEHEFIGQVISDKYLAQSATCFSKVKYYYSCSCGLAGTETFETGGLLAHNFGTWTKTKEPTCATEGEYKRYCKNDNCIAYEIRSIETLAHEFTNKVDSEKFLKSAATCKSKAVYYYSCSCGLASTTTFESGEFSSHVYVKETIAPTCTNEGYDKYTCDCGDTYNDNYTELAEHSLTEWETTIEPSCLQKGEEERHCLNPICSYGETRVLEKTSHIYNQEIATEDYLKDTATCTTKAKYYYSCVCGLKGEEFFEAGITLPHTFTNEVVDAKYLYQDATCNSKALYCYSCSCGERGEDTFEYGETLPHEYVKTIVKPTCIYQGYDYYACTCGDSYKENIEDALGHDMSTWAQETAPTCTTKGVEEIHCLRDGCSYNLKQDIDKIPHVFDKEVVDTKYIKAPLTCTNQAEYYYSCVCGLKGELVFKTGVPTGHTYTDYTIDATCYTQGYVLHTCSCGHSYKDSYTSQLTHNLTEWDVVSSATCLIKGTKERHCQRPTCSYSEVQSIDIVEHNFESYRKDISPTYTSTGRLLSTCTYCNNTKEVTLPILNDTDYVLDKTNKTTCLKAGYIYYSYFVGEQEFVYSVYIPSGKHMFTVLVDGVETKQEIDTQFKVIYNLADLEKAKIIVTENAGFTCNSNVGFDILASCEVCSSWFSIKVVDEHTKGTKISTVAPVCSDNLNNCSKGYTLYKCSKCYQQFKTDYVDWQHNLKYDVELNYGGAYVIAETCNKCSYKKTYPTTTCDIIPATCTKEGSAHVTYREKGVLKLDKVIVIPKIQHTILVDKEAVPYNTKTVYSIYELGGFNDPQLIIPDNVKFNCLVSGDIICKCSNSECGKSITIKVTGEHNFQASKLYPDIIHEATFESEGYTERWCTVCGRYNILPNSDDDIFKSVIKVESVTSYQGGNNVAVKISLANNTGVLGALLRINYDDSVLTLKNAVKGEAFASLTYTAPGEFKDGCVFGWDGIAYEDYSNGTLLTLIFDVSNTASDGDYNITLSYNNGDIFDEELNGVVFEIENGKITIS